MKIRRKKKIRNATED